MTGAGAAAVDVDARGDEDGGETGVAASTMSELATSGARPEAVRLASSGFLPLNGAPALSLLAAHRQY